MTWWTEFKPDRWVEVEAELTVQRWPVGTKLVHRETGRKVTIRGFEFEGLWAGWTGQKQDGTRCERFVIFPVYDCQFAGNTRFNYVSESDLREP